MTGLLDVLKETALDTGFLGSFQTSANREALPSVLRDQRLLLCLYGLGTNAGLKRVAAGTSGVSYDELKHIRRRYIDPASLNVESRATMTHKEGKFRLNLPPPLVVETPSHRAATEKQPGMISA